MVAAISLMLGNWITCHVVPTDALAGMAVVVVVATLGEMLRRVIPERIPAVFWVTAIGMALTGKVNFLALSAPLLTYAGLFLAKGLPTFRMLGWRIVATSLAANAGMFTYATLIAQLLMHKPVCQARLRKPDEHDRPHHHPGPWLHANSPAIAGTKEHTQ